MRHWIFLLCCALFAVPSTAKEEDPRSPSPKNKAEERDEDSEWVPPLLTDETEGLDDY